MTATGLTAEQLGERLLGPGGFVRRIPLRPAEGWLTLVAVAVMAMAFGMALRDAGWIPGRRGDSDYLPFVGLAGVAFGVLGAKVGWGRWRTHLVGALFGGLLLTLNMGGIALGPPEVGWDPTGLAMRMAAAYEVVRHVWIDLAINARPFTTQLAHYHLGFGVLVWGAGQLAGYTVFGHRRPLDAVVVLGLALLANMLVTTRDQLSLLVVFSSAALVLLIRTHVFEEEVTWARRGIGDPSVVGQLYLRGGAAFVTAAIVGSVLLTTVASSAPLQGLWADVPQMLASASEWLQRFAPPGGDFRGPGTLTFRENATTSGIWQPSSLIAFRATVGGFESRPVKWRAGTYAEYTLYGWSRGPVRKLPTAQRAILLADLADAASPVGRREFRAQIVPDGFRDNTILSPQAIQWVDKATEASVLGDDGWFALVETNERTDAYEISAMIPVLQDVQGGLTQARLRQAGTDYPAEVVEIYTALPAGSMGPAARALLGDIEAAVELPRGIPDNPYDLARTMEAFFRDPANFRYSSDVRAQRTERCADISTAECFAIIQAGYCEYYATTMAVLLRASGIPARIAYGFLPGERAPDGNELVAGSSAHWWVEVFFPGSGWVEFDPTGGGVGQPQPIPSGSVGLPTPRPSVPRATFPIEPTETFATGGGTTGGGGTGVGPFIAIALILVLGMGALILTVLRRAPRRPMHPDVAWGSLGRLAARFGLGPRPSQTVYEYAGALGDAVPEARVELTTIARAKVEVAYGRRDLGVDRLRTVALAYQRLRLAIVRFVVQRLLRRRRPRWPR